MAEDHIPLKLARDEEAWGNGHFPYHTVLSHEVVPFLIEAKELDGDRIMGILVTDKYGAVVAATSQPTKFKYAPAHRGKIGVEHPEHSLVISDIVEAPDGVFVFQGDTLDIDVPIMDASHTRVVGILIICYRFNNLLALVNKVRIGKTGHAMLFASDGTPLLCPILPRKAHQLDEGLLQMIVSDKPGWAVVEDDGHGARNTVVGFAPLEGLKRLRSNTIGGGSWHVFVRQPPIETFAPLNDFLFKIGGVGVFLVGMLAFLGKYAGERLVRPIHVLREGVEAMEQGSISHRLAVKTGDELETLGEAINTMAAGLEASKKELEASKKELEDANHSLTERVVAQTKELGNQVAEWKRF